MIYDNPLCCGFIIPPDIFQPCCSTGQWGLQPRDVSAQPRSQVAKGGCGSSCNPQEDEQRENSLSVCLFSVLRKYTRSGWCCISVSSTSWLMTHGCYPKNNLCNSSTKNTGSGKIIVHNMSKKINWHKLAQIESQQRMFFVAFDWFDISYPKVLF